MAQCIVIGTVCVWVCGSRAPLDTSEPSSPVRALDQGKDVEFGRTQDVMPLAGGQAVDKMFADTHLGWLLLCVSVR